MNKNKKTNTDGTAANQIANKMKSISNKSQKNKLEFFLKKQMGTAAFPEILLDEINDFPILKRKKLIKKLFLGTFHMRQSKSYVNDLLKYNKAFKLDINKASYLKNSNLDLKNSKIIGTKIISRHTRGIFKKGEKEGQFKKTYKVILQYKPNINKVKSILGILLYNFLAF